ncbi:hypothetical protein ACFQO1_03325 [Jejudonia soesokkakensis]|uniref:DUF4145 domain-containing protein n=1 Tax=Jejudonia soesokkakensis TaxID=1323432 RepID=A0ABW2MS53_9FLAO
MDYNQKLLERISNLMEIADNCLASSYPNDYQTLQVDYAQMQSFRTGSLSFILHLYGDKHPYYLSFKKEVEDNYASEIEVGISIIQNIKSEIENGWLSSLKGIITSEIFSDFMEMAEHLIEQGYKDPAAVVIGSVLEEHLRQLCSANKIETTMTKGNKIVPLSADRLNNSLAKANIYSKFDLKTITAQFDIRNSAAHGKYDEYDITQVELMYQNVLSFLTRNQL